MRILLLTQLFNPEPNYLTGLTFAKELVRLGHEVEVLTGFPCYPGGEIYDGYKIKLLQRETMEGIIVNRLPMYPSHDGSGFKRMINYGSLAAATAIAGPWIMKRPDVVHVAQGPATLALPAWFFRYLRGVPFVYNIGDLWPDSLALSGMFSSSVGLTLVNRWCSLAYRTASRIIVLSEGFKEELCRRGVPVSKIDVVYNWCEDNYVRHEDVDPRLMDELGFADRFNVVFAGTMGKLQALDAVLDAAAILMGQVPSIQLVFVGDGVELAHLQDKAGQSKLSNVRFVPRQPVSKIGGLLALADALLIHLKDAPLMGITIPQKTQAYMAAGRPIIIGALGESASIVERADAGIACKPEDPASIADAILRLFSMSGTRRNDMGANGRRFFQAEFAIPIGVGRIESILRLAARCKR